MIREQRWTPDTCANPATGDACVLIESWDDQLDDIARTHNFVRAEKLCSRHAATHGSNHAAAYSANYEENRRKNTALSIAQSVKPSLTHEQYSWTFLADGKLVTSFTADLTAGQKAQFQARCDLQFGPSKIEVK